MSGGHSQSGERPDKEVRAGMNHQGWFRVASLSWRIDPAARPCEVFAMLRWSAGPTVIARPSRESRKFRGAQGTPQGQGIGCPFLLPLSFGQAKERGSQPE